MSEIMTITQERQMMLCKIRTIQDLVRQSHQHISSIENEEFDRLLTEKQRQELPMSTPRGVEGALNSANKALGNLETDLVWAILH